jgi:hypothetical protein
LDPILPAVNVEGKIMDSWHIFDVSWRRFCEPGDSAVFVVDEEGRWCGLLFACPLVSYAGDGFALPAKELIEDIEPLMSGRVSIPH